MDENFNHCLCDLNSRRYLMKKTKVIAVLYLGTSQKCFLEDSAIFPNGDGFDFMNFTMVSESKAYRPS